eukprot:GHRR01008373.1.p1 GENE.GHRR01008373.1~~GHRR01008373.1.p1  ORF type:complete len:276 (+),score=69.37 GHRR01008373.1:132-959(+)
MTAPMNAISQHSPPADDAAVPLIFPAKNADSARRVAFADGHTVHHPPPRSSSNEGDADSGADGPMGCWHSFKLRVKSLKCDILALYYAVHDPRTPWVSKLLPWLVLAYALSPLDLIPDFIPVLGYLDDMLLLPLGLWLSYKFIPAEVMEDCRYRAANEPLLLERNWVVAFLVFASWTAGMLLVVHWLVVTYGTSDIKQFEWAVLAGCGGAAAVVFAVWLVSRIRYEARKRDEWNAVLLIADHLAQGPHVVVDGRATAPAGDLGVSSGLAAGVALD